MDFHNGFTLESDVGWDQNAEDITLLDVVTSHTYGGKTMVVQQIYYHRSIKCGLGDIVSGYGLFENTEKYEVDFILMGSAGYVRTEAQALANKCVAVAEARKDAVAFISPYRGAFITDNAVGSVTSMTLTPPLAT